MRVGLGGEGLVDSVEREGTIKILYIESEAEAGAKHQSHVRDALRECICNGHELSMTRWLETVRLRHERSVDCG